MKYFRSQNFNPSNVLDHSIWRKASGDIELNPTQKVVINGNLEVTGDVSGPVVSNVMYVTMDGDDNNDGFGESSNQAKRTLKSALESAQEGTTIYVRSGEYYEDNPLRVPPKVSILGDNLRRTILRPLNGPSVYEISDVERTNNYVTITTVTPHERVVRDRVRIKSGVADVNATDVNITEIVDEYTFKYQQSGPDVAPTSTSGSMLYGRDFFYVNSQSYIAQLVIRSLRAPAYCVNIDSDAIVDTSPYIQNCSNISGPWMRNGEEWIPFVTEQPDINGTMVTGPRPLLDTEIQIGQSATFGIDIEGAGGGMLIDGDRYSTESPIKSMVADAFTQVSQGGVGFHITNFGYMQLVSCFAVFCSKAFYTTRGGYLSISNSVCDFGTSGFEADGYYPEPYATGLISQNYYSTVGSITVATEGSGFTGTPIVTIEPPTIPEGIQATATASIDPITGRLNAISIDDPGFGYDFQPAVTITGGGGIGATAIANLSKNLLIAVDDLPNKPQVGSIMFLGNDPTGYYISSTVGGFAPFTYDEAKCRRDSGIILDGIYYDVGLGTNYNSVVNGRSYQRAMASEVIETQLYQTIGAIENLKTQAQSYVNTDPTALSRSDAGFDEIIDIIQNGTAAADAFTFPTPTGAATAVVNAKDRLIANRQFIRDEIIAWITDNHPTLVYDPVLCSRDVGYIVDGLCYDILYGGNSATQVNAESYFENSVSVLPSTQRSQTADAFAHLASIVSDVVQNNPITTSPSFSGTAQDVSGSPATSTEATTLDALVTQIVDVIYNNSVGVLPTRIYPSVAWASSGINAAITSLSANQATIINNNIDFINTTYATDFRYDQQKCRRDVAIIVGAVLSDMVFNSNYRSIAAGQAYLRSYSSKVTSQQKFQTIQGLEKAREETLALTVNSTAQSRITTNFGIVIDIINNGLSSTPTVSIPATGTVRGGYAEAVNILDVNRQFIKDELEAWIAYTYPTLVYDVATCLRDVDYITDAIRFDLMYEGNTQTTNAALAYAEGSVIAGQVEETQAAYEYWQTIVGKVIRNELVERTTGNTTTQDITQPTGTPLVSPNSPAETAESLLQIIIDVIDHGTGYVPDPVLQPDHTKGDATLNTERETILLSTPDIQDAVIDELNSTYGGSITVRTFPAVTSVLLGTEVKFHNVSTVSTGGTALEYVGAGVTYNALPFFGGEPVPENERIEINNGKCFTVSNDQVGNFRVGQFFTVNALTGGVTIDAENLNLSGLAAIGPFKRNGIPVGVQLREVSDNANLIASTGAQDTNTVPTQRAVSLYVENRYLNKVGSTAQTVVSDVNFDGEISIDGNLEVSGGDLTTVATTFNVVNTNATTVNAFGEATSIVLGSDTDDGAGSKIGETNVRQNLQVDGNATVDNIFTFGASTPNALLGTITHTGYGILNVEGTGGPTQESTLAIKGGTTGDQLEIVTTGNLGDGIGIWSMNNNDSLIRPLEIKSEDVTFNLGTSTSTTQVKFNTDGVVELFSNTASTSTTSGTLVVTGGVGISGNLNVGGTQDLAGDLNIAGSVISSSNTSFSIVNSVVDTVNFAGNATDINIGNTTGTTTVNHDLEVNGNTVLGDDPSDTVTINGSLSLSLPDNTASAFNLSESTNEYLIVDTSDTSEKIYTGLLPLVEIKNTTDSTSSANGALTVAGGVGIAKNLNVGVDLNVLGSTVLGDDKASDTVDIAGVVDINIPDNTASVFEVREDAASYIKVVTTNLDESVIIGSTPVLKVLNVTDSSSKDTGAFIVEGGVGIELNAHIGADLFVGRDATITGDLAVNGGDLTTTDTTFNLLNATATTINAFGEATAITIGDSTQTVPGTYDGTTTIRHNVDIDGDLNVDGGDITTNQTTFNLINANAVNVNFAKDATTLVMSATTGTTNIRNNLDVDLDLNVDGGDITTNQGSFNLLTTNATTINFAKAATSIDIGATTGTTSFNHDVDIDGDLNVDGGDITTDQATFNLLNTNATTVNFAGTGTAITIGAATGTTNIRHDVDIDGDLNVDGGDITTNATTFSLLNSNATTVNFAGTATSLQIAATTGTTTIRNTLALGQDLEVQYGGTGVSTLTEKGVLYGDGTNAVQVTAASDPDNTNATTSYGVLTTDVNNIPVWTDVIDGGSY